MKYWFHSPVPLVKKCVQHSAAAAELTQTRCGLPRKLSTHPERGTVKGI